MRWFAPVSVLVLGVTAHSDGAIGTAPAPVLVELFTSEGCSSCPPADAILGRLIQEQPVACARVIALGEHVDYWNDLGWKDPFSSRRFTDRQGAYVRNLRSSGAYTPQLVVGGRRQALGSDWGGATAAIAEACSSAEGSVTLGARPQSNGRIELDIDAHWQPDIDAEVLVALVQDRATSTVHHGENAGRTLTHVAVARSIEAVGSGRGAFVGRATVEGARNGPVGHAVVFVQERGGGRVRAVESIALPPP
jgi:hypothetical protein